MQLNNEMIIKVKKRKNKFFIPADFHSAKVKVKNSWKLLLITLYFLKY